MCFYRERVLPFLVEKVMRGSGFSEFRAQLLTHARGNVLEIGFGTGLNLPLYPPSVERLTGLDVSPGMIARAKRRLKDATVKVELVEATGERLPFPDEAFDTVVSTWTLCSIPDVEAALREIRRVLRKPQGQFLFVEHGLSPEPRIQRWQHRLTPLQRRFAGGCHLDRDIRSLLEAAGFSFQRIEQSNAQGFGKLGGYLTRGIAVVEASPHSVPEPP